VPKKCIAIGGFLVLRCILPNQMHKIASIHTIIAKTEDALVAAAQPYMGIEQEDNRDKDDDNH